MRIPRPVECLTCPVCGAQFDAALIRHDGFRCPECGTFLHADENFFYIVGVLSIALAVLISYIIDLTGLAFILGTA